MYSDVCRLTSPVYSVWFSLTGVATNLKRRHRYIFPRVCVRQTYLGSSQQTVWDTLACYSPFSVLPRVCAGFLWCLVSPPKSQRCDTAFFPSLPIVTSAHLNEHRPSCCSADVPKNSCYRPESFQRFELLVTTRAQITYHSFDGTAL